MKNDNGKNVFEDAINMLQGDVTTAAARLTIDPNLRLEYSRRIKEMSDRLKEKVANGSTTWKQAAQEAQETRNIIMDLIRQRSTPLGQAMAHQLKATGKTLEELVIKKAKSMYGEHIPFEALSAEQQNSVYASIVESAGRSNSAVNQRMGTLSRVGKGLLFLSIAISIREVYNADDKLNEAGRQTFIMGSGLAGGWAGGAAAGLVCGPGAPVCVIVGGFIGGALAAWGAGNLWS